MLRRRSAFKEPKRLFVISTEGERTEPIYFQEFNPGRDGGFRVHLLPTQRGKSRPREVLERLIQYEKQNRPGPNTEYWAVLDRDAWSNAELDEVAARVDARSNYHLALSNPCFELWLWLHWRTNRPFADRKECQKMLEREWPEFSKGNYDAAALMNMLPMAEKRAREADEDPEPLWPEEQATRVYRLTERLR